MKKLLYLITKAELGGAQSHVADLVRGFAGRYEVHLGVGSTGPLIEEARAAGATVHGLTRLRRSINPLADMAAVRECTTLIRSVQPDLIHAHSSKAGIVGRLAGRSTGVPTVFTAHGWGFSPGVPRVRQMLALRSEKAMAPLAKKIICVSEFDRQLALGHGVGGPASLCTVRGGIAPDSPQEDAYPLASVTQQPLRLIMVARFSEQKDQPTLLRALVGVPDEVRVDFVGSGPRLSSCQELANRLGVAERVSFLGDRHDVPALLRQAGAFVLSTHYEGFPISILEAMRVGLPVVASDVGGINEAVENGVNGLLVPRGEVEALSHALCALANAPDWCQSLGKAGQQKFAEKFTAERMISGTDAVYQEVWAQTAKH